MRARLGLVKVSHCCIVNQIVPKLIQEETFSERKPCSGWRVIVSVIGKHLPTGSARFLRVAAVSLIRRRVDGLVHHCTEMI